MNPAGRLFLAVVLIVAGGVISFWWAPSQILTAWAAEGWPTAAGRVESAEVYSEHSKNSGTTWYTKLRYAYDVDGKTYRSDAYSSAGDHFSASKREMTAFAAKHPKGSAVDVFYDPEDPTRSLLARGVHWKSWGSLAMGIVVLVAGGYFLSRELRARR